MNVISFLKQRGLINKISDENKLKNLIEKKNKGVYVGFDPSYKSLHLGNYAMINLLNIFAKFNLKTYALIGGATGRIGDPSGKKNERNLLAINLVDSNTLCIKNQLMKLTKAKIINNYDFYKNITLIDFLRDVGKKINLNYLLEKEIIKSRLNQGISFAETTYNLIQGNDFFQLYKNENVGIQIGGSDQWGNISTGLELIRKKIDNPEAVGITFNLFLKSDGTKFGKTEKNAIYLDPNLTPPFSMYQFLINQDDKDLKKLFMFFTSIDLNEIEQILTKHMSNPEKKFGQQQLACELITNIHGKNSFNQCIKLADALFYDKFDQLSYKDLNNCLKETKTYKLKIDQTINLYDFCLQNEIISSKRIFRQLIKDKALSVNHKIIDHESFILTNENSYYNKYSFIKKGKKNYSIIVWVKE